MTDLLIRIAVFVFVLIGVVSGGIAIGLGFSGIRQIFRESWHKNWSSQIREYKAPENEWRWVYTDRIPDTVLSAHWYEHPDEPYECIIQYDKDTIGLRCSTPNGQQLTERFFGVNAVVVGYEILKNEAFLVRYKVAVIRKREGR